MPSKTDHITINDCFFKKSAKLLPCQKEMMMFWANRGASQRVIATMFHVSRRTVQFTIDPDKLAKNLETRRQRGQEKYYDRDKHTKAMKVHRDHKKDLFNKIT